MLLCMTWIMKIKKAILKYHYLVFQVLDKTKKIEIFNSKCFSLLAMH